MGNSTSRKTPPVIAECRSPMYCLKKLGGRHLLLGGGGGAAKTGVVNQLEAHLLSFKKAMATTTTAMCASLASKIDTGSYATMNMDVVCVSAPDSGKYLIAAGHDQYCDIYETTGYTVGTVEENGEKQLSYSFRSVGRFTTDEKADGSYQKCVRFDKSTNGQRLITGGADGHLRVWDVKDIVDDRNPEKLRRPIAEINAHQGDIDDVDISPDGRLAVSVGYDSKVNMWDMESGRLVQELPFPVELAKGYKVRSVRFTILENGSNNLFFVVAYNAIQRNSKSSCYLALWAFNRERRSCNPLILKEAAKGESISSLCISSCGHFTGIGTLGGSVGIFDTSDEMKSLLFVKETHGIFVTAVEFLDRVALDVSLPHSAQSNSTRQRLVPGAAASHRASLVSLSADQTVQIHNLPLDKTASTSLFLLKVAIVSLLMYFIIFAITGL